MRRECPHCRKPLTPEELNKEESRGMEVERRAAGLHGLLFRSYTCSRCHYLSFFVDVYQLKGETDADFHRRKHTLADTVGRLQAERAQVVLLER